MDLVLTRGREGVKNPENSADVICAYPLRLPSGEFQVLAECWSLRNELYLKHLDHLKWKQEIRNIEVWLDEMEHEVNTNNVGESLDEVNFLIGKKLGGNQGSKGTFIKDIHIEGRTV